MSCINWYEAMAFCLWDEGRLPTEAEWNYAAAGGMEQREYPWSNPPNSKMIDSTYAAYNCTGDGMPGCTPLDILEVGSKAKGNGRWGHSDLAGNMWEWVYDWNSPYENGCIDCTNPIGQMMNPPRVVRGGYFGGDAPILLSELRSDVDPTNHNQYTGSRCARTP